MSAHGMADTPSIQELIDNVKTTYHLDGRIQSNVIDEVKLSTQKRKALIFAIRTIPATIDLGVVSNDPAKDRSQWQVEPQSYSGHVESTLSGFVPEQEIDHSLLKLALTESTLDLGDIKAILRVLGERRTRYSADAIADIEKNSDALVDSTLLYENSTLESDSINPEHYDQIENILNEAKDSPLKAQLRSVFPSSENLNALRMQRKEHLEVAIINAARRHGDSDLSTVLYKLSTSENRLISNTAYDAIESVKNN